MSTPKLLTDGYEGEDPALVHKTCLFCGAECVFALDPERFTSWTRVGTHASSVWPEQSADWREQLISGSCPECFDDAFGDED